MRFQITSTIISDVIDESATG